MKKIILILVVAIAGCTTKENTKSLKPTHNPNLAINYVSSTTPQELRNITLSKEVISCPSNHLISFSEACDMVSAMLDPERLYEMDTTYGLGGYMDSTDFTTDFEDGEVIQFFPCMNETTKDVFICYRDLKGYNSDLSNQCVLVDNEMLARSTNTFTYDKDRSQISPEQVANFISTMTTELSTSHEKLDGRSVRNMNTYFFSQYTIDGNDLNDYHCGAFNKCELIQLFDQVDSLKVTYHCPGIRFFFGYDNTRENKIRLILVGVNSNGSNLIQYATGEPALMFEKEWPPDAPSDSSSHH